jgi:hypothetical protein
MLRIADAAGRSICEFAVAKSEQKNLNCSNIRQSYMATEGKNDCR